MEQEEIKTEEIEKTDQTVTAEEESEDVKEEFTEEETADKAPDPESLIAEAEERGYRRALNEQAEKLMNLPALGERGHEAKVEKDDAEVMILNRVKRSVWE